MTINMTINRQALTTGVKKRLLAIDTTTEACSAALYQNNTLYDIFEICPRKHTERIIPMVQALLDTAEVSLGDMDAIMVCGGPGAFTGVRIGGAIAQGLSFGVSIPLINVSSLASIGWKNKQKNALTLVLMDARMGEVYGGLFSYNGKTQTQINQSFIEAPQAVYDRLKGYINLEHKKLTGAGSGWHAYRQYLPGQLLKQTAICDDVCLPRAADMIEMTLASLDSGETNFNDLLIAPEAFEPTYLRNKVAKTIKEREGVSS